MFKGSVIFDFDQTLVGEESTLSVLKLAIADKPECKKKLTTLLSPDIAKSPWSPVTKAMTMQHLLWQVNKAAGKKYVQMNVTPLPEIRDLLKTLKDIQVNLQVLSCGYREWVVPICAAWGIPPGNVHASSLFWLGQRALAFRPDLLSTRNGKRRIIAHWYKSGRLKTPVIIVGDGKKEFAAYAAGYGDAFVQANYFVNAQPFECSRPVNCVSNIADLKKVIINLLETTGIDQYLRQY